MFVPFCDLRKQIDPINSEIKKAIKRVFSRGQFILGPELEAFEKEFGKFCNIPYTVGCASGTEAIVLALMALGIGSGDEVITVPNTAMPTVAAISMTGARPVFVDVESNGLLMDPSQLEGVITSRTRAVLPVHLYGQAADMDPILEIAQKNNLAVIEDACQAHGAKYKNKLCGTLAEVGCFSFYPTKNLGAYGDAGLVVSWSIDLSQRLKLLRNYGNKGGYNFIFKGINSRLDEIQAAILRVKLNYLKKWNQTRKKLAEYYRKTLEGLPLDLPAELPNRYHVYHLYVVRCLERDRLQEFLSQHDIQTLIHYPVPIHLQSAYKELGYKHGDFPVAEKAANEALSLPFYPGISFQTMDYVAEVIRKFFIA